MLKTGSLKYSANLYEKPTGSFSLINPEMINKTPTNNRENWVMMFFMGKVFFCHELHKLAQINSCKLVKFVAKYYLIGFKIKAKTE
ncbi:hypothetical protein D3C80_1903960 [compost metagenome]